MIFSPPPARAARGGEGLGVVRQIQCQFRKSELAEPPPTPDPSPPLRGGRGEERAEPLGTALTGTAELPQKAAIGGLF
jgi:hypothetical protein